jgi:hypothetical protein
VREAELSAEAVRARAGGRLGADVTRVRAQARRAAARLDAGPR